MIPLIKGFNAVTHQSVDLLSPIEYRTIVEMIEGILSNYDFKKLDGTFRKLIKHLTDFSDPDQVRNISFYNEIVERVYAIYVNMLSNPLSLQDFKTQVAPTLGFVELFRRIVLNRYVYDQVKNADGSVPVSGTVFLSKDWGRAADDPNPITLTFGSGIASETDFIRLGWNGNTSPYSAIFTAEILGSIERPLPLVYETSAHYPTTKSFNETTQRGTLSLPSNDLTIDIAYHSIPTQKVNLLSLRNDKDQLTVTLDRARNVSVVLNNRVVLQSTGVNIAGVITLVIDIQGYMALITPQQTSKISRNTRFVFRDDEPFKIIDLNAPYKNLYTNDFGLTSVSLYQGYEVKVPLPTIAVPPGYKLLVDQDGAFICDFDGVPLIEVDLLADTPEFEGLEFLVSRDGAYLIDRDGFFLIVTSFKVPNGFCLVRDDDGALVRDNDGSFLTVPAYFFILDDDLSYLTDDDGKRLADHED